MVLSNKKLKQKLREAFARQTTTPTKKDDVATPPTSFKDSDIAELTGSASNGRLTLSKREKRRQTKGIQSGFQIQNNNMDQNCESKPKEKKEKNKKNGTQIEDKGTRLENGDNEGSNVSKKKNKKRKREEDKDTHVEEKGTQKVNGGDHLEKANVEESKTNKKKMKKQKKRKNGEKGELSGVATETSTDIIINAQEVTTASYRQESEYDALKVYVGGIPYYSNEDDIRSFFEGCGTVTDVDCMGFPDTGKFCGIALLSFKTEAAAKRALALDGSDMGGRYLKIQQWRKNYKHTRFQPTKIDTSNRAYIGNLAWDITEDDLINLFKDCEITSIRFGMDKTTGEFKGYGHVDFADEVSLAMALKLDQKLVHGRPIRISYAMPKREKDLDDSEKKIKGKCYNCGKPGHHSSKCPESQSTEKVDAKKGS